MTLADPPRLLFFFLFFTRSEGGVYLGERALCQHASLLHRPTKDRVSVAVCLTCLTPSWGGGGGGGVVNAQPTTKEGWGWGGVGGGDYAELHIIVTRMIVYKMIKMGRGMSR